MKRVSILLSVFFLLFSVDAFGRESKPGPYGSLSIGEAFLSDADTVNSSVLFGVGSLVSDNNPGLCFSGAAGYDFGSLFKFGALRMEAEINYQNNNTEFLSGTITGDMSSVSVLINEYLYADEKFRPFIPFIMIGAGFAKVETDLRSAALNFKADDTVVAYQFGAGIGYRFNDTYMYYLKYNYFATKNPVFDTFAVEYESNNIIFGLMFKF
jgi:opacity protein-like surface antigen